MLFNHSSRSPLSSVFLLVACVVAIETVTSAQPPDLFFPAATFASGGANLSAVAVADLNGDGSPDVVTANASGGVGVLLGNGDGTFQTAVIYQPASRSVAIADVNADGKPDLIVTVAGQSTVGVLLGNGDGTFGPPTTYFAGLNLAMAVAVADVNGDGHADVIVGDCGPNGCAPAEQGAVGVLLGNGDGTFQPVNIYAGGQPVSVAVADLNGDGKPDVVTANWALGTVGVLIGNGDGTFQTMQTYAAGATVPSAVALGDVNGDGRVDIAVASFVDDNNPGSPAGILLGNGDGTFQPVVNYSSGGRERTAVALADVDGDGIPDLLVASGCLVNDSTCAEGHIGVLHGNGDGTFQPAVLYGTGGRFPVSIAAVDVNGDGRRDLVAANYGSGDAPGVVGVLLNAIEDSEGPAITISASPSILWPLTGRLVPVTVSGTIQDTGSGVQAGSARYTVIDEYGEVQPAGPVVLGPNGEYSFVVWLEASRRGNDSDGRQYVIEVSAVDNAGNSGSNQTVVIAPHDQGKR